MPLSAFYKSTMGAQGVGSKCKECTKKASRLYSQSEAGKQRRKEYAESGREEAVNKKWRESPKGQAYLLSIRSTDNWKLWQKRYWASPKGKAAAKKYRATDQGTQKRRAAARLRRARDVARFRIQEMKFNKSPKGKARYKRWAQTPAGKAYRRLANRRFKASPKGLFAASKSYNKRKRLLAGVPCTLTLAEWEAIKATQKGRCHYCKKKAKLTQDHVKPVVKGGDHTKENIVGACGSCNSKKGSRIVTLF